MTVVEILQKKIADRGISISELARRTSIPRTYLYCSLGPKPSRVLRPEEMVEISTFFGLGMADYMEALNHEDRNQQNKSA